MCFSLITYNSKALNIWHLYGFASRNMFWAESYFHFRKWSFSDLDMNICLIVFTFCFHSAVALWNKKNNKIENWAIHQKISQIGAFQWFADPKNTKGHPESFYQKESHDGCSNLYFACMLLESSQLISISLLWHYFAWQD